MKITISLDTEADGNWLVAAGDRRRTLAANISPLAYEGYMALADVLGSRRTLTQAVNMIGCALYDALLVEKANRDYNNQEVLPEVLEDEEP